MQKLPVLLVAGFAVAALFPVACGDDGGTGGGGEGGSGTQSSSSTGPVVVSSTGTGTASCEGEGDAYGTPCGPCLEQNCCAELADAAGELTQAVNDCAVSLCEAECLPPGLPDAECNAPTAIPEAGSCVAISGGNECNPVTQEGCDLESGEACDVGETGFTCYPDGNTQALCETCGQTEGFCEAGYYCGAEDSSGSDRCYKYCCVDADCGEGTCTVGLFETEPDLGLCEDASNGTGGGGQGGGGGGQGGAGGAGGAGQGGAGGAMVGAGGAGGAI